MSFSNLSIREKGIIFLLLLFVIAILAYMFGIRTLNEAHSEMLVNLDELNQRKAYLDQLKEENVKSENSINELKGSITKYEQSFISDIKSENLEQYVLKTFEEAGMPYLASVNVEDVVVNSVKNADGNTSDDGLICKRVNVVYSSTDGYEALQYNITPELNKADGSVDGALFANFINSTGKFDETRFFGYDEFLNALKKLDKADEDCIKISKISAESTHGYMTLSASIDFYGALLTNRISKEIKTLGYAVWKGETGVNTDGGFIGMPYKVNNPLSRWNGVLIDSKQVSGFLPRPFAAYASNARFTQLIATKGLAAIVGGGNQTAGGGTNNQQQDENQQNQ